MKHTPDDDQLTAAHVLEELQRSVNKTLAQDPRVPQCQVISETTDALLPSPESHCTVTTGMLNKMSHAELKALLAYETVFKSRCGVTKTTAGLGGGLLFGLIALGAVCELHRADDMRRRKEEAPASTRREFLRDTVLVTAGLGIGLTSGDIGARIGLHASDYRGPASEALRMVDQEALNSAVGKIDKWMKSNPEVARQIRDSMTGYRSSVERAVRNRENVPASRN